MGDDAWIAAIETDIRMFNFHGDTTILTGTVVDKRSEGVRRLVDIEVKGTNQRKEVNVSGKATVLLPSRETGPVVLRRPDEELSARGARLMAEAAARRKAKAR
jgi:hypothetical protein